MSSRFSRKRRGRSARKEVEAKGLDTFENQLFAGTAGGDTKTIQLCRQVEEAISYALVCSTSPLLRELIVCAVQPLKGAAVLEVLVQPQGEIENHEMVLEALARATGYVRGEVARTINRKRVPTLRFTVMPTAGEWGEEVSE